VADFMKVSKLLTADKFTLLVTEGQYADKSYFIVKGCARAYYLKYGKNIIDWFAFENDFINSINSFFENIRSPHFIELLEPTTYLEISRQDIFKFSDKYHDFDRLGRVIVTKILFAYVTVFLQSNLRRHIRSMKTYLIFDLISRKEYL